MVLRRVGFFYNVSVHISTLLSSFEMLFVEHPEHPLDMILDPQTILEFDEVERLRTFQISKKHREDMLLYAPDKVSRD